MRLDALLTEKGVFPSRTKSAQAINEGRVLYKGSAVKPSFNLETLDDIQVVKDEFVSNGGYKLKKAINDFNVSVSGMSFADIGASNGGFTDSLLQGGASKVFAIDVGESQLDKSLTDSGKVVVLDNFNARYLTVSALGEMVDGVTSDVSFISVTLILDGIKNILKSGGIALLLIKPQFECGKEFLNKNGIVKSVKARHTAIKKVYEACVTRGLYAVNLTTAPVKEGKNVEYVIMLKNDDNSAYFSANELINKLGEI